MALLSTDYQTSLTDAAWASGQSINGLTDNEWSDLSDEIDNTTTRYVMADLEIGLASAAFSGSDSSIEVYIAAVVDNTNAPTWTGNATTDEQQNNQYFVAEGATTGASGAQRITIRNVRLPLRFRFGVRNRSNVTLAGAGNTLGWRPHSFEDA